MKKNDEPKIIINNNEAYNEIAKWLHLSDEREYKKILVKELLRLKQDKKILSTFRNILTDAGIPKEEICILNSYSENGANIKLEFQLYNANKEIKVELTYGDLIEDSDEISLEDSDNEITYEKINDINNGSIRLIKSKESFKTEKNNVSIYYFYKSCLIYIKIPNSNDVLSINLELSEENFNYNKKFELDEHDKLIEYLKTITLPIDILEIYKNICSISIPNIKKYKIIDIKNETYKEKKPVKTKDEVFVKNGNLEKVMVTKDGKRISVDKNDNWQYESTEASVTKRGEAATIELKQIPINTMDKAPACNVYYEQANDAVAKVKKLTKIVDKQNA